MHIATQEVLHFQFSWIETHCCCFLAMIISRLKHALACCLPGSMTDIVNGSIRKSALCYWRLKVVLKLWFRQQSYILIVNFQMRGTDCRSSHVADQSSPSTNLIKESRLTLLHGNPLFKGDRIRALPEYQKRYNPCDNSNFATLLSQEAHFLSRIVAILPVQAVICTTLRRVVKHHLLHVYSAVKLAGCSQGPEWTSQ